MQSVTQIVAPLAAANDVTLDVRPCPAEFAVCADHGKTEQIPMNLLSNALKFTAAEGTVEVFCGREGPSVTMTVRDTGPGIAADHLEAIFEPFVRVGRTLTSTHEGTGLGLAISRDLARAMMGDITVASVVGSGSAFTLSLPADGSAAAD